MADRVQFHLPERSDGVFEELRRVHHAQWLTAARNKTTRRDKGMWVRFAIRALHAHARQPEGAAWIFVKPQTQKVSDGPAMREPLGTSSTKIDVSLSEADRARVTALIERGIARSDAAVLRTAIAHLQEIAVRLRSGHELMLRQPDEDRATRVDLAALALEEELPAEQGFKVTLPEEHEGSQALHGANAKSSPPHYSSQTDELFSVLWFTTTFNRWLVIKVAEITQRAYVKKTLAKKDAAQQELDFQLDALLKQFLKSGLDVLQREFASHRLIPGSWRKTADYSRCLQLGRETLESYLKARFESGGAWSRLGWRNWTRSHDIIEAGRKSRECFAPIDWTAVAHHRLVHYRSISPAMVAHELQTWLVDAFGLRNRKHLEVLVAACARFNTEFYGAASAHADGYLEQNEKRLSLAALLHVLQDPALRTPAAESETDKGQNWPRAAYLLLHIARVIQPVYLWDRYIVPTFDQVGPRIRSLTYADVAEVRARLFGAQTAVQGLHWILRGGIVPRAGLGRVWLIHGNPGAGKSTFSAHLAADMARRGRTCIVLCAEERSASIRERLLMFGLLDEERYDVVSRDEFEALLAAGEAAKAPTQGHEPVKGLLVVMAATSSEPTLELSGWLRKTSEHVRKLRERLAVSQTDESAEQAERRRKLRRRWRWMSVVVDSVDALEIEAPRVLTGATEPQGERASMANLVRSIESSDFWGILVCGAHNPSTQALAYLADTVIELSVDKTGMHRRLEILKCRMQPFDPGAHVLQLVDGAGAIVHPNLAAIQRNARRRARPPLDADHSVPIPERIYWPVEQSGLAPTQDQERPRNARDEVGEQSPTLPWIRRGSAVLLHGRPQSGKLPFLLNLLAQRPRLTAYPGWPLGSIGTVLIVSFRGSEQEYLRPLKESPELGSKWRQSVGDLRIVSYGADETMRAAQITHDLVRRIQRMRRDGLPLDWIAFVGVEALHTNLPGVANEQGFWPTIRSLTASEAISTVFMAIDAESESGFVAEYGPEMDYVFRFGRRGSDRIVETEKSPDPPLGKDYPKLVFDPQQGRMRTE